MTPRIGGLCFGYGGLDLAVQQVIPDAELVWYSEIDKGANKVAAHRFPGVPNIGDMTAVDWTRVEPVDILTGGTPCQDLSHAGKRAGMTAGTRSNLWVAMREAVAVLRPSLVVWENVEGAASAEADSEVEPCPGCVGDGSRVSLRALGRVVGDLSSLGYVGRVGSLRAADVGAPHGRRRRFLVAYPGDRAGHWQRARAESWEGSPPAGTAGGQPPLLPTPRTSDTNGAGPHGDAGIDLRTAVTELHGKSLAIEAQRLLPTPSARLGDGTSRGASHPDRRKELCSKRGGELDEVAVHYSPDPVKWGVYADAITKWETLTRPAPPPTQPSKKGTPQLSPAFSEWMMGLPDGWVTSVPRITRNEALKAIGNGVCPQQGAAGLRIMLGAGAPPVQAAVQVLPTPTASDYKGATVTRRQEGQDRGQLDAVVEGMESRRLLPTPRASNGEKGGPNQRGPSGDLMLPSAVMNLTGDAHV